MITRLAHPCFFTDDIDSMLAFYSDKLGFPVQFTMNHDDGTPFGWYVDIGHRTFIELFDQKGARKQWGGEVGKLTESKHPRFQHICLEVEGLEAQRDELIGKGLEVTPIKMGIDNSYQCWITDPDGNRIELMEYTEKSLQFS